MHHPYLRFSKTLISGNCNSVQRRMATQKEQGEPVPFVGEDAVGGEAEPAGVAVKFIQPELPANFDLYQFSLFDGETSLQRLHPDGLLTGKTGENLNLFHVRIV